MPQITYNCCDWCNEILTESNKLLVYKFEYWAKNKFDTGKKDYIRDDDVALMACSAKCLGELLKQQIEEKEEEER